MSDDWRAEMEEPLRTAFQKVQAARLQREVAKLTREESAAMFAAARAFAQARGLL